MAAYFDFAIRKADLPRVNALRLDMGAEFWPCAAFEIFESAMRREDAVADRIPETVLDLARQGAKARGFYRVISSCVRVRHYAPRADVLVYLGRFARRCGLPNDRAAAIALVAFWASSAEAWPGAPMLVSETEGLSA